MDKRYLMSFEDQTTALGYTSGDTTLMSPQVSLVGANEVVYSKDIPNDKNVKFVKDETTGKLYFVVDERYLTFTAEEDNSSIGLARLSTNQTMEYSIDTTTWNTFDTTTNIPLNNGDKVYVRGVLSADNTTSNYTQFKMSGKIIASGNCNAIYNYRDLNAHLKTYCGYRMFYDCTSLTSAPQLPATTLSEHCYDLMFYGCESITITPTLPATVLAPYCYKHMFAYCTSIAAAPVLPATMLVEYCYYYMFNGCESLTIAPELPVKTLSPYCYSGMFYGCTSLTTAPKLPATALAPYCYNEMFNSCKSLTIAPELPATTLAPYCYYGMFSWCYSLTTASELPATTLSERCYGCMFNGCKSLTSIPKILPATALADYCYVCMFQNCTSIAAAPVLPATTLVNSCYRSMFYGCKSLTSAPELPATTLAESCYYEMFMNCTSLTTAPELPATTLSEHCYDHMFYKCASLTTVLKLPATALSDYCYNEMFYGCESLTSAPELPATTLAPYCYKYMFEYCTNLNNIVCLATDISSTNSTYYWVFNVARTGRFVKHPDMNDWTTGNSGIPSGWTVEDTYTPQECVKLEITADNVSGNKTNTTIYYTATTNGIDYKGDRVEGQIITGTTTSNELEQNKSYTDTVERTITFEFMGVTATTTITQGVWVEYNVVLNDQWRLSNTQSNPDPTLYDGVYESFSNQGVDNSTATMYIDLTGYTEFDIYIRSYAESSYDYVTISEPNSDIEKASTKGKQNGGQTISSYTKVHYDNLTGENRITITYIKDDSTARGNDRGYILILKQ